MSISLKDLVNKHISIHFLKRCAYLKKNAEVPEYFFNDIRHVFVLNMSSIISYIDNSIEYTGTLIEQVIHEPPLSWIEMCGLSKEKFVKPQIFMVQKAPLIP